MVHIFIDRSLSRRVAEALASVRGDVEWLEPRYTPDTPDPAWIADAGSEGWLVISKDKKLRTRHENWRAIQEHSAGCFVLTHNTALPKWEALKFIAQHLDEMIRLFEETPRPFIFSVNALGHFSRFDDFKGAP